MTKLERLLRDVSEMLDLFDTTDIGRHADPPIEPAKLRRRVDAYRRRAGWLPDEPPPATGSLANLTTSATALIPAWMAAQPPAQLSTWTPDGRYDLLSADPIRYRGPFPTRPPADHIRVLYDETDLVWRRSLADDDLWIASGRRAETWTTLRTHHILSTHPRDQRPETAPAEQALPPNPTPPALPGLADIPPGATLTNHAWTKAGLHHLFTMDGLPYYHGPHTPPWSAPPPHITTLYEANGLRWKRRDDDVWHNGSIGLEWITLMQTVTRLFTTPLDGPDPFRQRW